ncbi:MAG: hypothetical protein GX264_03805 [Clostridiales bacterium]|jgi:cystathionine beta-lyase family protein involved in aluminum resistance|nr:hypothetical protein [Clostridiales bacterium]
MKDNFFNIDNKLSELSEKALSRCTEAFSRIEKITEHNQQKVLYAFSENRVCEADLLGTTGYGYGDRGRETLDKVASMCFGAEDAIVRHSFASGTHTLTVALFGLLRPGEKMLCVTGTPYDTIRPVIGIKGVDGRGSLKDFGITYLQTELDENGRVDLEAVEKVLKAEKIKLVYIQRSRGYTLRPSLSVEEIGAIAALTKRLSDAVVMVDNCYGEFVQTKEPLDFGADIIAGSLIKNPGGGIAKCGGYIAGKKELVELCAYRMTAPGIGKEVGATLGNTREMLMGLFHAPHVVGEALKTAVFAASLYELLVFDASPSYNEDRFDIIQSVSLKNSDRLIAFCRGLQKGSPIDSFVVPEPWDMPGYDNKVIMAAGAFTSGSSIELSADAPLREPYAVWLQGGLNFHSAKIGILLSAQEMLKEGLITV